MKTVRPVHAPKGRTGSRFATGTSLPMWAVICFLCSGAAGLIYEIVWSKQLSYLLGSSLYSVATVTAAFLGGLALGARFLGPPLAHRGDPARSYALLELGVGLLGIVLLPVLRALDGAVGQLYRATGGEGIPFAIVRVVLLMVLLVPPAALMGATLPVLWARCERGRIGAGLAVLYAINTLGAVAGSLFAGFWLMPEWGLSRTTYVAAGLNLLAAAVAWRFASTVGDITPPPASETGDPLALEPGARRVLGLAFAFSGFAALALQLAWVRLYGLVLGSSVYSFAAVLAVYLGGIALGSALIAPWLTRIGRPLTFAFMQFVVALSAILGAHAAPGLPRAMLILGERAGASWSGLLVAQLGLVIPVLIVPCVLLGALFPLTTRLLQRGDGSESTGRAYALNTVGTITGSIVTGFLLLPWLGVVGVLCFAAALSVLAGLLALCLPRQPRHGRMGVWVSALLVALSVAAAVTLEPWDPVLMSLGTYRPFHALNLLTSFQRSGATGDPTRTIAATQRVLFYREGINASVLVATDLEGERRWMRVGGKIDASTGDMTTQVMLGLIPAVLADSGARTLIVGHGSGFTAAAALAAGAGRTDIVELESAVVEGSRLFHVGRPDPLDDPRVTLHIEDARTELAHGTGRYGLIISEPTNPWIAGVNNLFTVDFYRRVQARLEPDGVFCQWIQLYELSPETFHSMLASFLAVFPDSRLFCIWRSSDMLVIAAPPGRKLSWARLQTAGVRGALRDARLSGPIEVATLAVGPASDWHEALRGATLNTDDRPIVEYRAPRDLIEVSRRLAGRAPEVMAHLTRGVLPPAGALADDWPWHEALAARARALLADADSMAAAAVFSELRAAGEPELALALAREQAEAHRVARNAALLERTHQLAAAGDARGARAALEELAAADAAPPESWLALAQARWEAGESELACAAARRALSGLQGSRRFPVLLIAGMTAFQSGDRASALRHFQEARSWVPTDPSPYDYEARVRVASGDRAGARRAIEAGLARVPNDPALLQALRALTSAR